MKRPTNPLGTKRKGKTETTASLMYFVAKLMKTTWLYVRTDENLDGWCIFNVTRV